jgi:fimbrial chaperone protein
MSSQHTYFLAFALCVVNALAGVSNAQQVSVAPLRVNFKGDQQSEVLTLRNVSATPFTVQPKVVKWSQVDGKDVFEPTRDVLVAPPFADIPGGEAQVIRFSLRRPPSAQEELTYRVLLQQVVSPNAASGASVTFAWTLSLPIFVAPVKEVSPANLVVVGRSNGKNVDLAISNTGLSHIQVKSVKLESSVGSSSGGQMVYLLAGQSNKLSVPAPAGKSERLTLIADTDAGEVRREVVLQ